LYRIIDNQCLNALKHDKIMRIHAQSVLQNACDAAEEMAFGNADLKQLHADINYIISGMPDQMRNIFELSRFGGLKYLEIARKLGISVNTVETQMSRALARLRKGLVAYLGLLLLVLIIGVVLKK
jgi:RNA polymerase sigma-70 factor (ECF subfamily)